MFPIFIYKMRRINAIHINKTRIGIGPLWLWRSYYHLTPYQGGRTPILLDFIEPEGYKNIKKTVVVGNIGGPETPAIHESPDVKPVTAGPDVTKGPPVH